MAGTVRSPLNHYQILGVAPSATGDEIARAFAREGSVFRPHAFGGLAELCIAYETLRDPIKRQAYDASLGLAQEPDPQNRSIGTRAAPATDGAATAAQAEPRAVNPMQRPEPQPVSKPLSARTLESVHVGSPRPSAPKVAGQNTPAATKPALPLGPGTDMMARPEPRIIRGGSPRLALEDELGVEAHPINWRRTGIALGTVIVTACVLGGLAGWWSAIDVETQQPENTVSVALPPATRPFTPTTVAAVPPPVSAAPKAPLERTKPPVAAAAQIEKVPIAPEARAVEELAQQGPSDPLMHEPAAEGAPATSAVAATMPLPDRTIARTIQRIGYSCDRVASTVPVEGEVPGVYKVTCNSGQSYQARPVNGRYHFRRWGKR